MLAETNLYRSFRALLPTSPRSLATVVAHNADGTASVVTAEGRAFRVRGPLPLTIPYNAFVRGDRIEDAAPNSSIVQIEIIVPPPFATGLRYFEDNSPRLFEDGTPRRWEN